MAYTKISDIVVPEVFLPYVIEKTAEKSEIIQSGIITNDSELDRRATEGGRLVDMPFWQDLSGADEVLSDSGSLTVNAISTSEDQSRKHQRGKAWGANDLAGILAGDDPMGAIAGLIADFRARCFQAQLISSLKGVFAAASMSTNLAAIHQASGSATSANMLTGTTFIDATQLMGDQKDRLTAVLMHSAVESHLRKLDLIDYIPDSSAPGGMLRMFQGKRVVIDDTTDTATVDSKTVYSTYLFGEGAFGLGNSSFDEPVDGGHGTWQLEYGRVGLAGETWLANRWRNIMHPRGVKWLEDSVAGESPTNAELETASNWSKVYEAKNVRMIKVTHNIAA